VKAADGAGAVVHCGDFAEPLCACYTKRALDGLEQFAPDDRAIDVAERTGVSYVEWPDCDAVLSVNRPEDVIRAQALL
jgi:molybdopterin-guanine dinucleotide biosynthesis protein A